MSTAIEFNNVSKQYRLGVVSTKTLSHDLDRWWKVNVLRQEDPYLKIGSINDRATAADSEYVWALRNIDFKVEQGDVVGIIGKNGAGKSTLLKLLSKITAPTTGTINARGRIGALLEVGTGFHPEMTGRENVFLNGSILGMSKSEIKVKLDEIIEFSGCERYIDTPVKRYSSGMTVRLGFAVASHLEPEILVVDEVLAVGDAEFQRRAIEKMRDVSAKEGRTVLFVSHNMASIRKLCKNGILLKNGMVDFVGTIDQTIERYLLSDSHVDLSIAERLDRRGNGKLKFTGISFLDPSGSEVESVLSGSQLIIDLRYAINDPSIDISKMNIRVHITDAYRNDIVTFSSFENQASLDNTKNANGCRVTVPRLLLKGGNYNVLLYASYLDKQTENICDIIEDVYPFSVISSDVWVKGHVVDSYPQAMMEANFI